MYNKTQKKPTTTAVTNGVDPKMFSKGGKLIVPKAPPTKTDTKTKTTTPTNGISKRKILCTVCGELRGISNRRMRNNLARLKVPEAEFRAHYICLKCRPSRKEKRKLERVAKKAAKAKKQAAATKSAKAKEHETKKKLMAELNSIAAAELKGDA